MFDKVTVVASIEGLGVTGIAVEMLTWFRRSVMMSIVSQACVIVSMTQPGSRSSTASMYMRISDSSYQSEIVILSLSLILVSISYETFLKELNLLKPAAPIITILLESSLRIFSKRWVRISLDVGTGGGFAISEFETTMIA